MATIKRLLILASLGCATAGADPELPFLEFEEYASGFDEPVGLHSTPAFPDRLFVVEQDGQIRTIDADIIDPDAFLRIDDINLGSEAGLHGLAFPAGVAAPSHFYVHFNRRNQDGDLMTVIARFEIDPATERADPSSESVLLEVPHPHHRNTGGGLAFGPDGYLYVSIGDAVDPLNAQDRSNLLGKILRIDPEGAPAGTPYLIPPENPPPADPAHRPEILFWGLQDPGKITFHPTTGDLYVADDGEFRDEINVVAAADIDGGGNFGWPYKEGTQDHWPIPPDAGELIPPTLDYSGVVGGAVLDVGDERLRDLFISADRDGRIWTLCHDPPEGWSAPLLRHLGQDIISALGSDQHGRLFFADERGSIHEILAQDQPDPPVSLRPGRTYGGPVEIPFATPLFGSEIRFTLDGSDPTWDSPLYDPDVPPVIDMPTTLRARSFRADLAPSELLEVEYQFQPATPQIAALGSNDNPMEISITSTSEGVSIHYTVDGTAPDESSPRFEGTFIADGQQTIQAIALRPGWQPSQIRTRHLSFRVASPESIAPLFGLHEPVAFTSDTIGAALHYEPFGTIADENSPVFTTPIFDPGVYRYSVTGFREGFDRGSRIVAIDRIDPRRVKLWKIAPGGDSRFASSGPTSSTPIGWPEEVAVAPNGAIFAASNSFFAGIWMIANGHSERISDLNWSFSDLRFDAAGNLYAARAIGNQLLIFGPPYTGAPSEMALDGIERGIASFLIDDDGSFVVGAGDEYIYRYQGGTRIATLAGYDRTSPPEGPADMVELDNLRGITRLANGEFVFAEHNCHWIRKLTPAGTIEVVAGLTNLNTRGLRDGEADLSVVNGEGAVTSDRLGNIYFIDGGFGGPIRKIAPDGTVTSLRGPIIDEQSGEVLEADYFPNIVPRELVPFGDGRLLLAGHRDGLFVLEEEDWDNDLVPDEIERSHGAPFVVGVDDRRADGDLDGHSNAAEYQTGNDANDPADFPRSGSVRREGEFFFVTLHVTPGIPHQLEFSPDGETWFPMGSRVTPALRSVTVRDQASSLVSTRLYRARPVAE